VLAIAIAGFVVDEQSVRGALGRELGSVVGNEGARALETIVRSAKAPTAGISSTIAGLVVLLFGASGVFGELQHLLPGDEVVWQVVNFAISVGVVAALFAMTFRTVPDAKVSWRDAWTGGLVTAVLGEHPLARCRVHTNVRESLRPAHRAERNAEPVRVPRPAAAPSR
jgi:uncharacterized BrkB/YihY/UPF0761 family membrane protein